MISFPLVLGSIVVSLGQAEQTSSKKKQVKSRNLNFRKKNSLSLQEIEKLKKNLGAYLQCMSLQGLPQTIPNLAKKSSVCEYMNTRKLPQKLCRGKVSHINHTDHASYSLYTYIAIGALVTK